MCLYFFFFFFSVRLHVVVAQNKDRIKIKIFTICSFGINLKLSLDLWFHSILNCSFILFCFQVPFKRNSVSGRICVCLCTCLLVYMCHHEAPVYLSMAEPAGTAAILHSVGTGIWWCRGNTSTCTYTRCFQLPVSETNVKAAE